MGRAVASVAKRATSSRGPPIPTPTIKGRNNKEGTVVSSRASVLDDQKEVYKKIIENGTKVDVQFTTTDKAEPLESKVSL